jgi:photosystem II stability/assembly factor-like uncharacterized protein
MNKTTTLAILILTPFLAFSQLTQPPFTPAVERVKSLDQRKALLENSLVANVPFKSIGPSISSGRVADVDVWEQDPTIFYVAYASGGLWKTENNGQSFTPIFDDEMVMSIGDIAVDWERNVIWVGTGEVNSSRSSYSGTGMFRSGDGGKTWQYKGLGESHHIGRVLLHPNDTNTVWVAALGHLYSPNVERGVYKTTDGGNTWKQVLFVDANSGAVDLVMDPQNPDILYAATWHRERRAWNFVESGEGSGIYKSTSGGENWELMTGKKTGFPPGAGTGRIGLDAAVKDGKTMVFAIVDNQNRRPKEEKEEEEVLTKDQLRTMMKDDFLSLKKQDVADFLKNNRFPKKYTAEKVTGMVKNDEIKPSALVDYLENANTNLFDTQVIGAEVYYSKNGGKSWDKTHEDYLDNLYNSYGYYFGRIHAAANDPGHLYIYGVPILKSEDGGKSWKTINQENVHVDHHTLWIDPNRKGHLILGNDGGLNISYDDGENWVKCNTPAVGQFYYIAVDMEENYNVYGGLQDNGVWYGPHTYEASNRWHSSGKYPYKSIMGGDGMQVAVDTRDNNTVYTGFQFGNYFRTNKNTRQSSRITPQHDLGESPLRWNWQAPIHLSNHNQDIFYMGSNKLHRSFNQGDDWEVISDDLTKGGKKGDVPFGTLSAIHESPLKFGLLYTGSDDGLVQVSKDGGNTWTNISTGLPEDLWVARVQASSHEVSRVYVALNGYRWDDFRSLIYVSEDYGAHWTQIGTDLPLEPVNVIKEDPANANLLYVGTDHGVYISLDRGGHFMRMNKDLPAVPVHDLVVHPRDNDLIVGTHGRSLYLAGIEQVQQLVDSVLEKKIFAFEIDNVRLRGTWGNKRGSYTGEFYEPDISLPLFVNSGGTVTITVKSGGLELASWPEDVTKGLNFPTCHGTFDKKAVKDYVKMLNEKKKDEEKEIKIKEADSGKYYLRKGTYDVIFEKDGASVSKKLVIK